MKRFLAGLFALLLAAAQPAVASVPLTGAGKSGQPRIATFIGKIAYTATAAHATVNFPPGIAVGDLLIVRSVHEAGNAVAGWTVVTDNWGTGTSLQNSTYWKFASAGDVSSNSMTFDATSGNGPDTISTFAYRVPGATALTLKVITADASGAAGTTITNAGFTPSPTHYIAICFTDDVSRTTTSIITPSSNATMRDQTVDSTVSTMVGDIYPYVGGTITFGSASSATNRIMACYEVS